jgi:MFS family permease
MTSSVIGGALMQWPLGYLSDKLGRRKLQSVAAVSAAAVGAVIFTHSVGADAVTIVVLGAAWGAFAFPLYAISVAHTNDHADPSEYVMVSGGLLLMYGIGAIVGPFLASAVMTFTGAAGLYLFTAAVHVVLLVYTLQRMMRRESIPAEEHVGFGEALATAQTASQVYEEEIHQAAEPDPEDVTTR